MNLRGLGVAGVGWCGLIGCGDATSAGDRATMTMAGAGGNPQGLPAAEAGSADPGRAGSAPEQPPAIGLCAKLCVPAANFVFHSSAPVGELQSGTLRACRNQDLECYEGKLPPSGSVGNAVSFEQPGAWQGPSASSVDGWETIHFTWSGLASEPPLRDGDHFTVTLQHAGLEVVLLDHCVQFETVHDCAGPCEIAYVDQRVRANGASGSETGSNCATGEGGATP
jgi:hypothetical protein